ncbi:flagellar biosynthetic protein FliO [Bradyrhizobium prioriisuperbiae]|uniref:flagellar biosynthetic protein FliO n=1 Tax=Bradyrhizobium prioriisuperbiae TaxID=2854389 RepID=UPI0028EECB48|nr:flagellar biosynthetic protein FliO [Bradyrhizobium prioritasuperba]
MPQLVTFALIFLAVLAIVGLAVWLVSRFGKNRIGSNANRGRMPRLAVIDAATVDTRRRLVLVRRDNVEHLLMIGGPTDIVIEPNIVRAVPQREQTSPRGPIGAELPPRVAPLPDAGSWADTPLDGLDHHDPVLPELPPRPTRPSFADEARRPSPSITDRRSDPLAAEPPMRPEPPVRPRPLPRSETMPRSEPLISRGEPSIPRGEPAMPRSEPISRSEPVSRSEQMAPRSEPLIPRGEPIMPRSAPPPIEPVAKPQPPRVAERPAAPALSAADQNLAEMAQRLEAALRKPSEPAAAERAPPVVPESPGRPAPRPTEISVSPPPRSDTPAPPVAPPGPKATSFENLEDEMASLLGRPKSPT